MTHDPRTFQESAAGLAGVLGRLTVIPGKRALFHNDSAFRSGWHDWQRVFGCDAFAMAHQTGLLLLKPEILVVRRWRAVLDALFVNGFRVTTFAPVTISRSMAHEFWRYAWNNATVERMDLAASLVALAPSVAVFVTTNEANVGTPVALRLTELKGSVDPARRNSKQIRSEIRMTNKMIGFVHTADEPADLIREVGVLFDTADRRRIAEELAAPCTTNMMERLPRALECLADTMNCHDLDPDRSWKKIQEVLGSKTIQVERALTDDPRSVVGIIQALDTQGQLSVWDAMSVVASAIHLTLPDRQQLIEATDLHSAAASWQHRTLQNQQAGRQLP